MNANVYNMDGQMVGEVQLSEQVFSVRVVPELIYEAVVAARANRRVAIAHTKTRGEVRGGGKKPWKQKGTGRARHGSIRSPLWIGGGVVGGPRSDRNFSLKINRKARRNALRMALGDKALHGSVIILDTFTLVEPKTKLVARLMDKLPIGKQALFVMPNRDPLALRATRNIPSVTMVTANAISLIDVLTHSSIIMPRDTIAVLEKLYGVK